MAETLVERIHALARKCAEQDALLKSLIAEVNVESLEKPYTAYKADPADIVLDKLQDGALVVTDSPATVNFRLPNVGEIVTSLTPLDDPALHLLDGARLSINGMYKEGLEKIVAAYDSTPLTANVHKIGNLVENGTVISGFSSTSYAKVPYAFSPRNSSWEMVFKITTGSNVSTHQEIISRLAEIDSIAFGIAENKLSFWASSDDKTFNIANKIQGTHTIQPNTTYYFRIKFSGTVYTVEYSTDGSTYITDIAITSSTPIRSGNSLWLGLGGEYDFIFQGSIDFTASYININNTRWWSGTKRGIFTTEAEWQSCVNQHEACGKFVYDSVANTVRLPLVTGFMEGTIDSSVLGDLVEAGLPNITGKLNWSLSGDAGADSEGALYWTGAGTRASIAADNYPANPGIDASRSSPIYGNSTTVQPQSTKVFYYIVLANTISTPVVADIQREVDSKVSAEEAAHAAMPSGQYIVMTVPASGGTVVVPADGWISIMGEPTTSNAWVFVGANGLGSRGIGDINADVTALIPVKKESNVAVAYYGVSNVGIVFTYAEGAPTV